jgi:hypothetical protein
MLSSLWKKLVDYVCRFRVRKITKAYTILMVRQNILSALPQRMQLRYNMRVFCTNTFRSWNLYQPPLNTPASWRIDKSSWRNEAATNISMWAPHPIVRRLSIVCGFVRLSLHLELCTVTSCSWVALRLATLLKKTSVNNSCIRSSYVKDSLEQNVPPGWSTSPLRQIYCLWHEQHYDWYVEFPLYEYKENPIAITGSQDIGFYLLQLLKIPITHASVLLFSHNSSKQKLLPW